MSLIYRFSLIYLDCVIFVLSFVIPCIISVVMCHTSIMLESPTKQ